MHALKVFWIAPLFLVLACGEDTEPDIPVTENPEVPDEELFVVKLAGETQGTTYHITYLSKDSVNYQESVEDILMHFDYSLSNWVEGSLLRAINNTEESCIVIRDSFDYIAQMYYLSDSIYHMTEGAFDPTVAPLVNAWGFGFSNADKVTDEQVRSLQALVGFSDVGISEVMADDGRYNLVVTKRVPEMQMDFNAIAQGFSVDVITDFLEINGVERYMVEIGGELRCKGKSPSDKGWVVQVDEPVEGSTDHEAHILLEIENKALATSGNYRKVKEVDGKKYSHTIHPATGYPVKHQLLSATVIADDCAAADAYATAIMVWGVEETQSRLTNGSLPPMQVYLIYQDESGALKTWQTDGIGELIVQPAI